MDSTYIRADSSKREALAGVVADCSDAMFSSCALATDAAVLYFSTVDYEDIGRLAKKSCFSFGKKWGCTIGISSGAAGVAAASVKIPN